MSWYQRNSANGNGNGNRALLSTPRSQSQSNQVQVSDSSPIHITSSPAEGSSSPPAPRQPSLTHKIDEAKRKDIERKRQLIREHKDFPLVRRRFHYLSESDIFKGFVKGNGVLRDVTRWLEENYNYDDYIRQQREIKAKQLREDSVLQQRQREEQLKRDYEANVRRREEKSTKDTGFDDSYGGGGGGDDDKDTLIKRRSNSIYDDENGSPVRVKGKARVKLEEPSPFKETNSSTKVEIKSKQSILDKYKKPNFKNQHQPTLENFGRLASLSNPTNKKRKLARGSLLDNESVVSSRSESSSPVPAPTSLSARFSFNEGGATSLSNSGTESPLDELEESERRIAENRRKAKLHKLQYQSHSKSQSQSQRISKHQVITISDDEDILDDDNLSDSMSEDGLEVGANEGITSIDAKIFEFINNAPIEDIIDISGVEPEVAEVVISQRPFQNIYEISENDFTIAGADAPKSSRKKKVGLRMIEQTESSLRGYKAIDSLIKKCAEYGDIIATQMKKWGVTNTGTEGELDLVDLDPMDSGDDGKKQEDVSVIDVDESDDDIIHVEKGLKYIKHKPLLLSDEITLNNYQQVGVNWINLLYQNRLSCILADEMGLGKTCQVIAFLAYLKQAGEKSPHLIVVPASTIENWIREFDKFCPEIKVQAYYGTQREREDLRYDLQDSDFEVLITTYSLACGSPQDAKFLRNQNFNVVVYDEGHLLKNSQSERYSKLMRLKGNFRLLLTGTPLQNNLKELISLLAFILPDVFNDKKEDLVGIFRQKASAISENEKSTSSKKKDYNPLLSQQAIKNAKTMMTPFVLRRRKDQVLQHLPVKCHEICYCQLTIDQAKLYNKFIEDGRRVRSEREKRKNLSSAEAAKLNRKDPIPTSSNVLMQLRKASLHPLLFRVLYTDDKLKLMAKAIMNEPEYVEANQQYICEDMTVMSDFELNNLCMKFPHTLKKWQLPEESFLNSGKVIELEKILDSIIHKKHEKVLIFSLFTQVLDILEKVLTIFNYKFVRLDGSTKVEERQETIDIFYQDDTIPIFLLSTKAGGFGINLVAANNVIIFDQSFNPHDDKQAEDRAHRVGQTKEVTVYKLITDKTVETNMLMIAENKLQLDQSISGDAVDNGKFEENAASIFEKILFSDKKSI
ncbi:FUN30 [Candida oxycetoniae]|uniref:DNA helicase n=1 Tax=Candida oxycetoniae TaxID=497107 RepID=A0AAI9WVD8_9ASCO|nr:FUN30 [Candida oxycetoniae]KAI3402333.2 FUN30 [Candida oxycetoniae]